MHPPRTLRPASRLPSRMASMLACLVALTSCTAPATPVPSSLPSSAQAAQPATAIQLRATTSATAAPSPQPPATIASPAPTRTSQASTAAPALPTAAALPPEFILPTATPLFPEPAITAENVSALRPLRSLGVGAVRDASVAPAGRLLAVATTAGLALFELPALRLVRFERREASQVALSPDGRWMVVDRALVRVADGAELAVLDGREPSFSPNGQLVATLDTGTTPTIHIWRATNGESVLRIPGHRAAFSRDGQRLAVSAETGIQLLRLPDGNLEYTLARDAHALAQDIAFGSDGQTLLAVLGSELQEWRVADGKQIKSQTIVHADDPPLLQMAGEVGQFVDISPAGDVFASVFVRPGEGVSIELQLRSTADGHLIDKLSANLLDPDYFSFSADGTAAVGTADASLKTNPNVLQVLDTRQGSSIGIELPTYTALSFSPDAQTLATASVGASNATHVDLWRVIDGTFQQSLEPKCDWGTYDLAFVPTGQRLAGRCVMDPPYGDHNEELTIWSLTAGGQVEARWGEYFTPIRAFSPAGTLLATKDTDSLLIDATRSVSLDLDLAADFSVAAFSPNGATLAAGDAGGIIQLFSAGDGARSGTLEAGGPVNGLFFSPDGALLGARRDDGLVQVWRLGEMTPIARLGGAADETLIFTSDNSMAITAGKRGVIFYRLSDGKELRKLDIVAEGVAIGPRLRLLAILRDGVVELWGIER
jgi:WD40 repeat protein